MKPLTLAVDWDGTLVDPRSQQWLPGAEAALDQLLMAKFDVIVHSSRANWAEGVAQIKTKLGHRTQRVRIEPKPPADFYVDNRAIEFHGDWAAALRAIWRVKP